MPQVRLSILGKMHSRPKIGRGGRRIAFDVSGRVPSEKRSGRWPACQKKKKKGDAQETVTIPLRPKKHRPLWSKGRKKGKGHSLEKRVATSGRNTQSRERKKKKCRCGAGSGGEALLRGEGSTMRILSGRGGRGKKHLQIGSITWKGGKATSLL